MPIAHDFEPQVRKSYLILLLNINYSQPHKKIKNKIIQILIKLKIQRVREGGLQCLM